MKLRLYFILGVFLAFCVGLQFGWYQRSNFCVNVARGVVDEIVAENVELSEFNRGSIAALNVYADVIEETRFFGLEVEK